MTLVGDISQHAADLRLCFYTVTDQAKKRLES